MIHRNSSTLDSTDHDAFDDVLLQERINADDRQGGEHDAGGLKDFRRTGNLNGLGEGCALGFRCGGNQLIQLVLDHLQSLCGDVILVVSIGIPAADGIKQGEGCKNRLGKRKNNLEQDLEIVGTVQKGGFLQRIRNAGLK